jgi:hypothetical protein
MTVRQPRDRPRIVPERGNIMPASYHILELIAKVAVGRVAPAFNFLG